MPFFPNMDATLERVSGYQDFGEVTLGEVIDIRIGVVRLRLEQDKTSVRTDTSATRGNAAETHGSARLLFETSQEPNSGDRVTVHGRQFKVTKIFPRFSVQGILDHFEVDCEVWQGQ